MSFQNDFLWGAASAAYQVEGAYDVDGRGPSIWDALSDGHIRHGENGNTACEHYYRFKEDVALMKEMGLKAYRFSVSWSRVIPQPGVVNEKGLQFYRDLVQELVDSGIEPLCTLFHWDLPMWVHEKGGWRSSDISDDFVAYTKVVVDTLSDKVSYWITFNEPACFIGNGYIAGMHAPFEKGLDKPMPEMVSDVLALTRNVLLAHGKAVKTIRAKATLPPLIGMALNGILLTPKDNAETSMQAAKAGMFPDTASFSHINWWADPTILGKLPQTMQEAITPEELVIIHQPIDFFGYNCYHTSDYDEYYGSNPAVYPGMPRTAMDWPITPDALYWAAKLFTERYGLPILVTENGMANVDFVMSDGKIHDPQRIEYLKGYIDGLQKAADEGVPLVGYMYWSLMDNFEWAEGYDKRFGLVYVDYRTQKRTRKESSFWYADVINNNGL